MSKRQAKTEENFASALQRLRYTKGLTQVELAAMIGRTARSVTYFEAGHHAPNARAWAKLRAILGDELPVP